MRAKSNPFQGRREDLSQRSLSDEEKLLAGGLVGKDKEATRSVVEFYQIGKSAVGRCSRYYKDKAPPKKSGRASKLDDASTSAAYEARWAARRGLKRVRLSSISLRPFTFSVSVFLCFALFAQPFFSYYRPVKASPRPTSLERRLDVEEETLLIVIAIAITIKLTSQ